MADKHLLIVYHSQSGTTERMAEAVIRGARHDDIDGVTVRVLGALEADADDVLWSDAMILGTPENFGYMSGGLKVFLDRIYYPCLEKVEAKPYALFVRAGNDGTGAVTSVQRIVAGLALKDPATAGRRRGIRRGTPGRVRGAGDDRGRRAGSRRILIPLALPPAQVAPAATRCSAARPDTTSASGIGSPMW